MKILGKCESCKKRGLFIRKRSFVHKHTGPIKSQSELCGKCAKGIKNMLGDELE